MQSQTLKHLQLYHMLSNTYTHWGYNTNIFSLLSEKNKYLYLMFAFCTLVFHVLYK